MLFLSSYYGYSQQYPVQVTTTLAPPYSLYLSDYTAIGSNNLQVLVNLLELDRPNLQIKFRITIEGAGITLRTNPTFMPRPLNIQGGVPELFTGADLTSYFNPDHLDFTGITRAAFKRSGQLPEGFYTFTLEVLEYNRNVRISNQSISYAWIVLNDPPLLNTPFNGDKLIATDPQNIMFSWTPRHTASPNAAFSTEYEFRLVEMYPGQTNPDIAIRSSNSIYTTTTTLTSLNYGIIEPTLIPGKRYAFRVRAYDTSGRDLFKNDGYSETYVFQYGDDCGTFEGIAAKTLDPQRARISWEPEQNHTGCVINYRKNGKEDWFTQEVNGSYGIVAQLSGRTTYEYQLIPQCGTIQGEKSPVMTFTTPEVDESGFVCGAPIPEFDGSDIPLMKPLLPLDVIQVGDWTVNLLNVSANGDGTYGGAGYAAVPNFNLANVRVVFDRILVNEDYQVVAGDIKTVYSEDSRFVLDIKKKEEETEVVEESGAEGPDAELTEDLVADVLTVNIEADIGEVVFSGGLLEVYDESGNLLEDADLDLPPEGEELTITDSNGDTWVVDSEGGVSSGDEPDLVGDPNDIQFVREQLIKELLQHYKDEIAVWLENQDKGPLDDHILNRILSLPDCLPENEEDLNIVLEKIEAFLEDPESLLSLLEEDEESNEKFGEVAEKLKGKTPPYKVEFSPEEWINLVEMICWYLTVGGEKYYLPLTVTVNGNYYLINKEKTSFTPGDTLRVHTYMAGIGLILSDSLNQKITLTKENFIDIEGTSWGPDFIIDIKDLDSNLVKTFKILIKNLDTIELSVIKEEITDDLKGAELEAFKKDAEEGIDNGESWNPDGYACNNAVRAFLYYHKFDTILFPETMPGKLDNFRYGSGLKGPNDTVVLKGSISWDGTADKMWDDFEGNGNDLTSTFSEITKNSSENWNDYFDRLQDRANKGTIIVGVVHSDHRSASRGHIVALMPKNLCNGDQRVLEDWNGEPAVYLPCALEAGGDLKKIKWFAQNSSEIDDFKWFEYDN